MLWHSSNTDGESTVSSTNTAYTSIMEPDAPFQPVRNGEVVLFSINIRRTCEAFGIPLDDNLQKEFQSFSLKTYVAVVDKVCNRPV